jgi:gentisate 1,2-dioxygenase
MVGSVQIGEELRRAWESARLMPLWESPTAHKPPSPPDQALHWSWETLRPLLDKAMTMTSPEVVERRVLQLVAEPRYSTDEATVRTLAAALQILLPGERARPHRHTMSALRFVLEGAGATTYVDGKPCAMAEKDLILTPAWTWHEHVHQGDTPIIWLDVLDVPLHAWLGTAAFQPGPVNEPPHTLPDDAFLAANIVPVFDGYDRSHSPIFRYPYAAAKSALRAAPARTDGSRRVRYANPFTGGPAMPLMDVNLLQIEQDRPTTPFRTNANAVCCVVEGAGQSKVGEATIRWRPNDVFTLPQHNWITHIAETSPARLLITGDRDAMQRLGVLTEEFGG